jgi:hypothetical protein
MLQGSTWGGGRAVQEAQGQQGKVPQWVGTRLHPLMLARLRLQQPSHSTRIRTRLCTARCLHSWHLTHTCR